MTTGHLNLGAKMIGTIQVRFSQKKSQRKVKRISDSITFGMIILLNNKRPFFKYHVIRIISPDLRVCHFIRSIMIKWHHPGSQAILGGGTYTVHMYIYRYTFNSNIYIR